MKSRVPSALSLLLLISAPVQAGLIGATANISAYYPDTSTVYQAGANTIVSAAIEYPVGTFSNYNSSWEIDITDTQITISDSLGAGFPYQTASFNGWALTILSGPTILSAVPDATSQFNPVAISILPGNRLFLNYSGVSGPNYGTSVINITTVPEPASVVFFGLLAIGVGLRSRAHRRPSR